MSSRVVVETIMGAANRRDDLALQAARLISTVLHDNLHPSHRMIRGLVDLMSTRSVVAATLDSEVISTGSLMKSYGTDKIVNVATHSKFRGQGIGALVMEQLEEIAVGKNATRLALDARPRAIPFYLRLGYEIAPAPPFAPPKTQHMAKNLSPAPQTLL